MSNPKRPGPKKNVLQAGPQIPVNKLLVLVLAILCGVAGGISYFSELENESDHFWSFSFIRVAIVLVVFWIALPKRGEDAPWLHVSPLTLLGILLALWATVRYPRTVIPVAIAVAAIGYFLKPKDKARPKTRSY